MITSRRPIEAALLLLLGVQACAPGAARAEPSMDPPRYNAQTYCMRRSNTDIGFSDDAQAQCLAQQRMAYDVVRREWSELPEITQDGCDAYTRATHPDDYTSLRDCIDTQKRRVPAPPDGEPPQ